MKTIDYKTVKRWPTGHHNPHKNIVVSRGRGSVELESGHGARDNVYVFGEDDRVFVLAINHGFGYVGLSEYEVTRVETEYHQSGDDDYYAIEEDGNVFVDRDYDIDEMLGPKGLDLSPMTIAKRLIEYLPY